VTILEKWFCGVFDQWRNRKLSQNRIAKPLLMLMLVLTLMRRQMERKREKKERTPLPSYPYGSSIFDT
jgi:hypothetical protein